MRNFSDLFFFSKKKVKKNFLFAGEMGYLIKKLN